MAIYVMFDSLLKMQTELESNPEKCAFQYIMFDRMHGLLETSSQIFIRSALFSSVFYSNVRFTFENADIIRIQS